MNKPLSILLCLLTCTSFCVNAQTRIGVYVSGVLGENYNTLLGDNLVEAFTASNQYIAINRSKAIYTAKSKARTIQESGHIDQAQVVNQAKEYGETQICVVEVIEMDGIMYVFRATLLDMLTNVVIKTSSANLPKSEIGYAKLLEVSQKLSNRLLPDTKKSNVDIQSLQATSEIELARKKVQDNSRYNISYADFKADPSNYMNSTTNYYMNQYDNMIITGGCLLGLLGGAGIFAAGMGYGLYIDDHHLEGEEKQQKVKAMLCCMGASLVPGIVILAVAPACRRKAWKEYRRPYDEAVKDLDRVRKYQQRASLNIFPAVGYEWAGVNLRLTIH